MKNQITIIIPTLSNLFGLKKLLILIQQEKLKAIIIDNAPNREKKRLCKLAKCLYLPQNNNQGFARSINLAVNKSKTDWLLFLNDDVELVSLDELLNDLFIFAKKNELMAATPILLRPSGRIENAGYILENKGKINFVKELVNEQRFSDFLDGISATCLLIKKDVFNEIGQFKENYFAYLEDVDLFLRLKKSQHRFGVSHKNKVLHHRMSTSKKMGLFKPKQDIINWLRVIYAHWPMQKLLRSAPDIFIERLKNIYGLVKFYKKHKKQAAQVWHEKSKVI